MLPHQTACPRCTLPLQSNKPFAPGQRLRCPRCTMTFVAPGLATALEPPGLSWLSPPDAFDLPLDLPPTPEPAPAPKPRRNGSGWVGAVLGLVLLAGALAVGLVLPSGGKSPPEPQLAAAPVNTEPKPAPAPIVTPPPAQPPRVEPPAPTPPPPLPDRPPAAPAPPRPTETKKKTPAPEGPEALPAPQPKEPERPERDHSAVKGWLTEQDQRRVDEAMLRAIDYLKSRQLDSGSWHDTFFVTGNAALPALALIECGVPADDAVVQKAAQYVRDQVPILDQTYEIALALLLLDRIGASSDEERIRSLALRLLAGQEVRGGWTYKCPLLSSEEEQMLLVALQKTRPRSPLDLFLQTTQDTPTTGAPRPEREPLDRSVRPPDGGAEVLPPPAPHRPAATLPLAREIARAIREKQGRPLLPVPRARAPEREPMPVPQPEVDRLPAHLRNLPAVQPPQRYQRMGDDQADTPSRSDNSNTQFAVLGLWAARRHGVPMDRALALMAWRFQTSQSADGSWGYKYALGGVREGRASMTGSALLGLAVGQGLTYDYRRREQDRVPADPRIQRGLAYLAEGIEPAPEADFFAPAGRFPGKGPGAVPAEFDSYLLWTVERVGVLYNLRQIQGRDWYRWGATQLLSVQQRNGSWPYGRGQERPVVGTSFGLLFLKGSNLVPDLTRKLEAGREEKK